MSQVRACIYIYVCERCIRGRHCAWMPVDLRGISVSLSHALSVERLSLFSDGGRQCGFVRMVAKNSVVCAVCVE